MFQWSLSLINDNRLERTLNSYEVYCPHKEKGCESGKVSEANLKVISIEMLSLISCLKGVNFKIFHVRFVSHIDVNGI